MFGPAKQTTPIGHRILCANPRTMSKQHHWMRRFSYDLLSIPELFKNDALIDHSYKSYNPQIGTSLKILKCVLMCRASGKLISGFNMIQQFQSWQSWPRQDSGHGCRGNKIWTPSWLRSSFGPWFEVISGRRFGTHTFRYLHIRSLELPTCQVTWGPEALRFLAHPNCRGLIGSDQVGTQRWPWGAKGSVLIGLLFESLPVPGTGMSGTLAECKQQGHTWTD